MTALLAPTAETAGSALRTVLPGGRIRPGTTISMCGDLPLLQALAAAANPAGWATLAMPAFGHLAAVDAGLDLAAGLHVDQPGGRWQQALAILIEAVPVVLLGDVGRVAPGVEQRIAARLRRSGAVLLTARPWGAADVRLQVVESRWEGVGAGHGLLTQRRFQIMTTGRGAAGGAPWRTELLVPGPTGAVAAAEQQSTMELLDELAPSWRLRSAR